MISSSLFTRQYNGNGWSACYNGTRKIIFNRSESIIKSYTILHNMVFFSKTITNKNIRTHSNFLRV